MSGSLGQVGSLCDSRHLGDLKSDDLKVRLRDQKRKHIMQSLFCGAAATLLAAFINRAKPLNSETKVSLVLLGIGVTGISYLLLILSLKIKRIYTEINQFLSEKKKENQALKEYKEIFEVIKKEHGELSYKVKRLEKKYKTLLKEQQPKIIQKVAKICEKELDASQENVECEKMVRLIKDFYLDVNATFEWNKDKQATFLTLASETDNYKIILKLLELGASPYPINDIGCNCFHNVIQCMKKNYCMTKNNFSIIDYMLKEYPELINIETEEGNTPLQLAISLLNDTKDEEEDLPISKLLEKLIKAGADVNAPDVEGNTTFDDIFSYGKPMLIKLFMIPELKIEECKDKGYGLIEAIINHDLFKDLSFMDLLLGLEGWGIHAQKHLIHFACDNLEEELLQKILEKWAFEDTSQNHFINERSNIMDSDGIVVEHLLGMYLLQKLMENQIDDRPEKKRIIASLLKYTDCSKLTDFSLTSELVKFGYHEILKEKRFDGSKCSPEIRKVVEKFILEQIKRGVNKEDYIETFKLIYQPGDPIDEDLQLVFREIEITG